MSSFSLFRVLAPIVGGVVAGATVVVLSGSRARPQPPGPSVTADDRSTASTTAVQGSDQSERQAQLERRIADLEARMSDRSDRSAKADRSAPPRKPESLATREAETQRELDNHQKLLAQHGAELRDPAWAIGKERDVGSKLRVLAATLNRAFSVHSVDCRASSCVAQLDWPNETAAKAQLKSLLSGSSDLQCARQIAFPPADGSGPYSSSLYLDCAELRWGGSSESR